MKNISKNLNQIVSFFAFIALVVASSFSLLGASVANAVGPTQWNTTGSYVIDMEYQGSMYPHDMTLSQNNINVLSGNGGSPAGANVYTWVINTGTVVDSAINFTANYTATPDAVTPQTVLTVVGTIGESGSMSGTWSDNYAGGERSGTWSTTSGHAAVAPTGEGEIGGEVIGSGTLAVTSVTVVDSQATADGTFANGWKYTFNVTLPTNETHLSMKFMDWAKTGGGGTIPVANNMRISSLQADNAGATVLLTAQNTYSTPTLHMVTDMDPVASGVQTQVTVEVSIPVGSSNGAYTTSYGIQSV